MAIKGYKKTESSENFSKASFLADALRGIDRLKTDLIKQFEKKSKELDAKMEEVREILERTSNSVIEQVKEVDLVKGNPGKDADEKAIEERVLSKISTGKDIENIVSSKIPKIDEDSIARKVLSKIPKQSSQLKVVQENVEVDPLAVIDKIMALPEEKRNKLKLKTDNVDGLSQTISAIHHQLGRGYLHGAGISTVSHDLTLTGLGTVASPLSVVTTSSNSVAQTPEGDNRALLIGDVNGVNTTFSVPAGSYGAGVLLVKLNGQDMTEGSTYDFVETDPANGVFDFIIPPETGDRIIVQY